jgi:hypothetical protein
LGYTGTEFLATITLMMERITKTVARTRVKLNKVFSMPRLVLKTDESLLNVPLKASPLDCKRITRMRTAEISSWMILK